MRLVYIHSTQEWKPYFDPQRDYIAEAKAYMELGNIIPSQQFTLSPKALSALEVKRKQFISTIGRNEGGGKYEQDGYKSSYEKYSGAYGYDDDTIDNAFEGDPENYWNVD